MSTKAALGHAGQGKLQVLLIRCRSPAAESTLLALLKPRGGICFLTKYPPKKSSPSPLQVDVYHTFFGIAGLALMGYPGLQAINPTFALPQVWSRPALFFLSEGWGAPALRAPAPARGIAGWRERTAEAGGWRLLGWRPTSASGCSAGCKGLGAGPAGQQSIK